MKRLIYPLLIIFVLCFSSTTVYADDIVYVTKTGSCYHIQGCSYLKSSIPISLEDAKASGYYACSRCNPDKNLGEMYTSSVQKSSNQIITKEISNKKQETNDESNSFLWLIVILFGVAPIAYLFFNIATEKIMYNKEKRKYYDIYAHKDAILFVDIPEGTFIENELPVTKGAKKYGIYTVYISKTGNKYHTNARCGNSKLQPTNIVTVMKNHSPCSKCVSEIIDIQWYNQYINIIKIKKKYNIP